MTKDILSIMNIIPTNAADFDKNLTIRSITPILYDDNAFIGNIINWHNNYGINYVINYPVQDDSSSCGTGEIHSDDEEQPEHGRRRPGI